MIRIAYIILHFVLVPFTSSLIAANSVPDLIILDLPANMERQVSFTESVLWNSDPIADSYELQISADIGFTNLEVDSILQDTSFLYLGYLEASTTYFWRVRGKNSCGDGDFSETWRFTIGKVVNSCLQVSYTSDPFPIEDHDTIQIGLNFSAPGLVTAVRVTNVDVDHPAIGDISLKLRDPQGLEVSLVENICGLSSGMNLGFADGANSSIPCPPTTEESYQPIEALDNYFEARVRGQWNLWIADQVEQNEGWLNTCTLEVCFLEAADDCTPMVDLNGTVNAGTYHFVDELSSAGSLQSNATIQFKAGNAININENFKTGNNSVLELIIEDCEEDLP